MHQIIFQLGLCHQTLLGSLQCSPNSLSVFKWPTCNRRGKEGGEKSHLLVLVDLRLCPVILVLSCRDMNRMVHHSWSCRVKIVKKSYNQLLAKGKSYRILNHYCKLILQQSYNSLIL